MCSSKIRFFFILQCKTRNNIERLAGVGGVDVLIGLEYAGYHLVQEKSAGHLLAMRNCCGVCLGEPRRLFQEKTKK